MKRKRVIFLVFFFLFLSGLIFILNQTRIAPSISEINRASTPTANNCQTSSATRLWADKGKLYLYNQNTTALFSGMNLCHETLIEMDVNGHRVLLGRGGRRVLLGVAQGFCYYLDISLSKLNSQICAYELNTGEETRYPLNEIIQGSNTPDLRISYTRDGQLLLAYEGNERCASIVMDGAVPLDLPFEKSYLTLGNLSYYVDQGKRQVVELSTTGEQKRIFSWNGEKDVTLFPMEDGILLYVPDSAKPLYWIDRQGQLSVLFSINSNGEPPTAMNFIDGDIFLSIQRYGSTDGFFNRPIPGKNDPISGTYIIRTDDFSAKKIDDTVYTGFFVFDNGFIYACDKNGSVIQFDREWNMITAVYDNSTIFPRVVS